MILKDPWILILIPLSLSLVFFIKKREKRPALRFGSLKLFGSLEQSWKMKFRPVLSILRLLGLVLFIFALSGPRSVLDEARVKTEGIDIVLAIDASGSMAAEDFTIRQKRRNRLYVVKEVVKDFIGRREHDRLGLIAFGGLAYTVSPLTTDYNWLISNLERVELDLLEDGTAIGSAISSSLARLRKSSAESKIIVLLTDGVNNSGKINPVMAAQAADTMGVKIYTIGAGSKGEVPFPVPGFWGRTVYQKISIPLDENLLKEVAALTGGNYYRATDTNSLREIYDEIDKLEKTEIEEFGYREYKELFPRYLILALLFIMIEVILSKTIFLEIP